MADRWYAEMFIWPAPNLDDPALRAGLQGLGIESEGSPGDGDAGYQLVDDGRADGRKRLHIFDHEATYGSAFFVDSSLVSYCRERGLCFVISDTGRYEYCGEERSWRPGLAEPLYRNLSPDGEPILDKHLFETFAQGSLDHDELAERVRGYFAYDPHAYSPGDLESGAG